MGRGKHEGKERRRRRRRRWKKKNLELREHEAVLNVRTAVEVIN